MVIIISIMNLEDLSIVSLYKKKRIHKKMKYLNDFINPEFCPNGQMELGE